MKLWLAIVVIFILAPSISNGQGEMLLLKKKGRVFKSYFQGSQIMLDAGLGWEEAQITRLKNDSIVLTYYQTRPVMTSYGTLAIDTVGKTHSVIDYKWIQKIGEHKKGMTLNNSGAVLFGGGTILTASSLLARAIAKKDTRYYPSTSFLITSASAAALGFLLMQVNADKSWKIGKKYTLQFISTN